MQEYIGELTGVLIVQNEAAYIEKALDNILRHVKEVVVVDGGSRDGTLSILKKYGVRVFHRAFDYDFGAQRNFAMEQVRTSWVLSLDADEYFSEAFFEALPGVLGRGGYDAYLVKRHNIYLRKIKNPLERWYRLWKQGSEYQIKLFKSELRYEGRFHEKVAGYHRLGRMEVGVLHNKTLRRQRYNEVLYNLIRRRCYCKPESNDLDHINRERIE